MRKRDDFRALIVCMTFILKLGESYIPHLS